MKTSAKIFVTMACFASLALGLLSASIIQSILATDIPQLSEWSQITGGIGVILCALLIASAIPVMLLLWSAWNREEREEERK